MSSPSTATRPIDRNWVLEQIGGDENLLREIAAVFLIDSPDLRRQLAACLARQDFIALHGVAHCSKSAVGNFGSPLAVSAAVELEEAAKSGDPARLSALTDKLCAELLRVEDALRQEVL